MKGKYYCIISDLEELLKKKGYVCKESKEEITLPYIIVCKSGEEIDISGAIDGSLEVYLLTEHGRIAGKTKNYSVKGNTLTFPYFIGKYLVKYLKVADEHTRESFIDTWHILLWDILERYNISMKELKDLIKECAENYLNTYIQEKLL